MERKASSQGKEMIIPNHYPIGGKPRIDLKRS
jgi:hypothetical protein